MARAPPAIDHRCQRRGQPAVREARAGVEKLAPGSYATLDPDGQFAVHRYWDPVAAFGAQASGPEPSLARVLEGSVRAHLVADVEIEAFLSGGLDSTSFVGVLDEPIGGAAALNVFAMCRAARAAGSRCCCRG